MALNLIATNANNIGLFLALDCACGWATGKFYDHQKYNQRG
jgi:hypothetical protein